MTLPAIVCSLVAALAVFVVVCHACLAAAAIHAGGYELLAAPTYFFVACLACSAAADMIRIAREIERDAP